MSKVLERHIYNIILNHLVHCNPLTANQWGFLEGRSTVTSLLYIGFLEGRSTVSSLLYITDQWPKELESGLDICAVFFYFRKAFDSVPHLPLMSKISSLGLAFNTSKCKYMVISRKPPPKLPHDQLQLLGMRLQAVESYKYLGLLLSSDTSWSPHIESICSKARQILGLLYIQTFLRFHKLKHDQTALLIHGSTASGICMPGVGSTSDNGDKCKLESVQKFGLKLASCQWDAGYNELLDLFNLPTLKERRIHLKLGLLFKIVHNLCYFPHTPSLCENVGNLRAPP